MSQKPPTPTPTPAVAPGTFWLLRKKAHEAATRITVEKTKTTARDASGKFAKRPESPIGEAR